MIWIIYALLSAISTSLVSILAKVGMRNISPLTAVTIQTCVMCVVFIALSYYTSAFRNFSFGIFKTYNGLCILTSAIMASAATLFFFKALSQGYAYKVTAVDRLSFALVIVLSAMLLGEVLSYKTAIGIFLTFVGIAFIALGA